MTNSVFIDEIPTTFQAMQTARAELKLSQKDVAQKVNEKPSVIQDYESGKAIPSPQVLGKLERVLGVKLRGSFLVSFVEYSKGVYQLCCLGSDIGKKLDKKGT